MAEQALGAQLNRFQADRIEANVSIRDVLTKRFVIDVLACDRARIDAKRETPGKVYEDVEEPEDETPIDWSKLGDAAKLKEYYDRIKDFNEKLQKLKDRRLAKVFVSPT